MHPSSSLFTAEVLDSHRLAEAWNGALRVTFIRLERSRTSATTSAGSDGSASVASPLTIRKGSRRSSVSADAAPAVSEPTYSLRMSCLLSKASVRTTALPCGEVLQTFTLELDGAAGEVLHLELMQHSALIPVQLASLDLSVASIRALVGASHLEQSCDYWIELTNIRGETVMDLRVAFEFHRRDSVMQGVIYDTLLRLGRMVDPTARSAEVTTEKTNLRNSMRDSLSSSLRDSLNKRAQVQQSQLVEAISKLYLSVDAVNPYATTLPPPPEQTPPPATLRPLMAPSEVPAHWKKLNAEWQSATERLLTSVDSVEKLDLHKCIADASSAFVAVAETYGKVIIRELSLPVEQKSIQPLALGGLIGGEKFISNGVLYKLANDHSGIFQSDDSAAKVAGHELKCLTAVYNAVALHHLSIALPLIALVDYMGYRLIALALCPLDGPRSLISGSCDGALNIVSGIDVEAEKRLTKIATHLNVKPHSINSHLVPLCVDCELHAGGDGRLYLIDLSRVLPPEEPSSALIAPHLYRMLRGEFVRSLSYPVCSDGFSNFLSHERDRSTHNGEIVLATRKLKEEAIPMTAGAIDQLHTGRDDDLEFFSLDQLHCVLHVTHAFGINFRYLGAIFSHSFSSITKQLLLVELVSRSVKHLLRRKLRHIVMDPSTGIMFDNMAKQVVVDHLNSLFCPSAPHHRASWDLVALELHAYFGELDSTTLKGPELFDELSAIPLALPLMFQRLSAQMGLEWDAQVSALLVDASRAWVRAARLPSSRDTKFIYIGRITGLSQDELAAVFGGSATATSDTSEVRRRPSAVALLASALKLPVAARVRAPPSLADMPWNVWANSGDTMVADNDFVMSSRIKLNNQGAHAVGIKLQAAASRGEALKEYLLTLSCDAFQQALSTNPSHSVSLRYYANNLFMLEALRARVTNTDKRGCMPAERYWSARCRYIELLYLFSLSSDPCDAITLYEYGVFLKAFGQRPLKSAWLMAKSLWYPNLACEDKVAGTLLMDLLELGFKNEADLLRSWIKKGGRRAK